MVLMRIGPRENRGQPSNRETSGTSWEVPRPSEVVTAAREGGEDEFKLQSVDRCDGIGLQAPESLDEQPDKCGRKTKPTRCAQVGVKFAYGEFVTWPRKLGEPRLRRLERLKRGSV